MEAFGVGIVVLGALCAGFVTGLAGFGTGLTALAFWLHVVEPAVAAALVAICSVVAQLQSLYTVRREMVWRRVWPFLLGGVAGVPLGVGLLRMVDSRTLKVVVGLLLVGYAGTTLGFRRFPTVARGGRLADGAVGFGGGVLGGLAGLSGPLSTIWCALRGWKPDAQRAVYQPYNLAILALVLGAYATQGVLTGLVWGLGLACLPATLIGVHVGLRQYSRVNDRQFRYLVLWLLLASGLFLTASNLA